MKGVLIYGVGVICAILLAGWTLTFVEHRDLVWPFVAMQGFFMGWVFRYFDLSGRFVAPASKEPHRPMTDDGV